MNQQLIFNNDFSWCQKEHAVRCSCLLSGLKVTIYIERPQGLQPEVWLAQVKEESFVWEESIEHALQQNELGAEAILRLKGAF